MRLQNLLYLLILKPMKLLLLLTLLACTFFRISIAQVASWPLTSNINGTGSPGITAHPVAFGCGYSWPSTNFCNSSLLYDFGSVSGSCSCLNGLRIRNWRVQDVSGVTPSLNGTTAVNQSRYVEFSFTNNTGGDVTVNSFDFTANAGFSTNCTGTSPYSSLRWMIDGVHATPQWIRHPSACASEQSLNLNSGNAGACNNFSRPNSAACGTGWTSSNPIIVANGQRVRFRIYIATSHSESSWRVVLGNVVINGIVPLAVTLHDFNANCESNGTEVSWSTSSEQNASHFDLQRSIDGEQWNKVATIPAAGNSTSLQNYTYTDPVRYISSTSYYRLRQVDFDGAEEIHRTIAVDCDATENSLIVFPNPSAGEFTVEVNSTGILEDGFIGVYDLSGKQLLRQEINTKKGTNVVYFTENNLASGTYLVVVESETKNAFKPVKLVIQ